MDAALPACPAVQACPKGPLYLPGAVQWAGDAFEAALCCLVMLPQAYCLDAWLSVAPMPSVLAHLQIITHAWYNQAPAGSAFAGLSPNQQQAFSQGLGTATYNDNAGSTMYVESYEQEGTGPAATGLGSGAHIVKISPTDCNGGLV